MKRNRRDRGIGPRASAAAKYYNSRRPRIVAFYFFLNKRSKASFVWRRVLSSVCDASSESSNSSQRFLISVSRGGSAERLLHQFHERDAS